MSQHSLSVCIECGVTTIGLRDGVCLQCRYDLLRMSYALNIGAITYIASRRFPADETQKRLNAVSADGVAALAGRVTPTEEIERSIEVLEGYPEQTETVVEMIAAKKRALRARAAREVLPDVKAEAAGVAR